MGEEPREGAKCWSSGCSALLAQPEPSGQEAKPWIPQILIAEPSGAEEAAPGSTLSTVSAHFSSQTLGEAYGNSCPLSSFSTFSPPRLHTLGSDNAPKDAAAIQPAQTPHPVESVGVSEWRLGVPSPGPVVLGRLGPVLRAGPPPPYAGTCLATSVSWENWAIPRGACNILSVSENKEGSSSLS